MPEFGTPAREPSETQRKPRIVSHKTQQIGQMELSNTAFLVGTAQKPRNAHLAGIVQGGPLVVAGLCVDSAVGAELQQQARHHFVTVAARLAREGGMGDGGVGNCQTRVFCREKLAAHCKGA